MPYLPWQWPENPTVYRSLGSPKLTNVTEFHLHPPACNSRASCATQDLRAMLCTREARQLRAGHAIFPVPQRVQGSVPMEGVIEGRALVDDRSCRSNLKQETSFITMTASVQLVWNAEMIEAGPAAPAHHPTAPKPLGTPCLSLELRLGLSVSHRLLIYHGGGNLT